jgi:hypothetical protein
MRDIIVASVKNYSEIYFSEDVDIVEKVEFESCKCAKILLIGRIDFNIILRVSDDSLAVMSEKIFGVTNEEMKEDLTKEILNIIAGDIQKRLNRDYELTLPKLCDDCKVKNGLYFKNSVFEMAISIQR